MTREYTWRFGQLQEEVGAAQELRYRGFSEENGIPCARGALVQRDVSEFDNLPTTHHALVYNADQLVATARLAVQNARLRQAHDLAVGVEVELEFEMPGLAVVSDRVAEIARVCVLRGWHGTEAVIRLYEALYARSLDLGIRYWIGGVDCQTDHPEDALLMYRALVARDLSSREFRASARPHSPHLAEPFTCPFYSDAERNAARRGELGSLRIASTLKTFTRRLNAECLGPPALHPAFPRWVVPMIVDLSRLPADTLSKFDRTSIVPPQPTTPLTAATEALISRETRRLAS